MIHGWDMPWIHCWLGYFKILIVDTSLTQLLPHSATSSLSYFLTRLREQSGACQAALCTELHAVLPDWACFSCMLLPDCICFSCCSPIASASISYCSLLASGSAATPRTRPLQLLLPNCIRFSCCSPIASVSAANP